MTRSEQLAQELNTAFKTHRWAPNTLGQPGAHLGHCTLQEQPPSVGQRYEAVISLYEIGYRIAGYGSSPEQAVLRALAQLRDMIELATEALTDLGGKS